MRTAAHPFGDPQTVQVARDGGDPAVVHVTWKVGAADDLTLLGIHLGVLPEDRVLLDGAVRYDAADAALVGEAPELETYLLDHVAVTAGGAECSGEVAAVGDLVADGADLAFTCDSAPGSVAVEVTTLTDLHPAYRTLATGPEGQHRVYAADAASYDWALGTPPAGSTVTETASGGDPAGTSLGTGQSAALQIGGVLGAVLLLAGTGALVVRARRRRIPSTPTT
ncbi:MAG TPA: hypothetical protein VNS46_05995 [Nocardioides sp.]|nr:hypothetical protein [Nocardioides sp.]